MKTFKFTLFPRIEAFIYLIFISLFGNFFTSAWLKSCTCFFFVILFYFIFREKLKLVTIYSFLNNS